MSFAAALAGFKSFARLAAAAGNPMSRRGESRV
jgi:hypothetical protein